MRLVSGCWSIGAVLVTVATVAGAQPAVDGVRFSTIPPGYAYETLGVVTDIQHIPAAIFDLTKPFKEVMQRLYPELARQAKVVGGDAVIITNFEFIPGGQGDHYLQVYGTAIRTRGPAAPTQDRAPGGPAGSEAPPASTSTATGTGGHAQDLSGTWSGTIQKGDNKPVEVTVTLTSDGSGKYSGGLQAPSKKCDMLLAYYDVEDGATVFKTEKESGFRCLMWAGQTAKLTPEGKLEWKVYTIKPDKPTYSGILSR
jgi:hypothetical protein